MEFEGKCIQILPERTGNSVRGGWTIQSAVFETAEQYPKKICATFFNHQDEFSKLALNNIYNCAFSIESREFNGKWYTDVRVFKVTPKAQQQSAKEENTPFGTVATPAFQGQENITRHDNIPVNGTMESDDSPF